MNLRIYGTSSPYEWESALAAVRNWISEGYKTDGIIKTNFGVYYIKPTKTGWSVTLETSLKSEPDLKTIAEAMTDCGPAVRPETSPKQELSE